MNFPNCSRCGKPHRPNKEYENWSVFNFKKPELKYIPDSENTTYFVLCPDCTRILENSLIGYRKKKETTWSQA